MYLIFQAYRGFTIPENLEYLWKYIEDAYATDAFKESCPANEEIIKHYERGTQPDRKRSYELRRIGTSLDVPVRTQRVVEEENVNGDAEEEQEAAATNDATATNDAAE